MRSSMSLADVDQLLEDAFECSLCLCLMESRINPLFIMKSCCSSEVVCPNASNRGWDCKYFRVL